MEPRLTLLNRLGARWHVRVELPTAAGIGGLTVGLYDADGRPLGPGVVCPVPDAAEAPHVWDVEVGGPARLPAGTVLQCLVDVDGREAACVRVGVGRRRGVHAWLHADARLDVPSDTPSTRALSAEARKALAHAWSCLAVDPEAAPSGGEPDLPPAEGEADGSLLDLLRDEFGVDVDEMAEDLRDAYARAPGSREG
ncbi:MAG: hypothetical protein RLZZ299_627 [Pseudomonadota bacterium]|jgi:hypothetical protein